jgi:hypothetical protein
VYISRDVIFDESVFPFSSMHDNAGAQLKAKILPPMLRNIHEGGHVEGTNVTNAADVIDECHVGTIGAVEATNSTSVQIVVPAHSGMDLAAIANPGIEFRVDLAEPLPRLDPVQI